MDAHKLCFCLKILFCLTEFSDSLPYNDSTYYNILKDLLQNGEADLFSSTIPVRHELDPLKINMSVAITQLIDLNERTQVIHGSFCLSEANLILLRLRCSLLSTAVLIGTR